MLSEVYKMHKITYSVQENKKTENRKNIRNALQHTVQTEKYFNKLAVLAINGQLKL